MALIGGPKEIRCKDRIISPAQRSTVSYQRTLPAWRSVDQQPPEVREGCQFRLAVALDESGKTTLINTPQVDGRIYHSCRTVVGDVFLW